MDTRYRITFRGDVVEGHIREQVMETAAARLGATAEQTQLMFSGRPAILKKNLDETGAQRYVAILARIGMLAVAEPMPETVVAAPPPVAAPAPTPVSPPAQIPADEVLAPPTLPDTITPQYMAPPPAERSSGLSEPYDPERTHIASHSIMGGAAAEQTGGIGEPFDPMRNERADHSVMPTQIVVRKKPAAPTVVEQSPDHELVATYLDSIQALAAETNTDADQPEVENPQPAMQTEIRPTPQRAAAHMESIRQSLSGPATITPDVPPRPRAKLPDPPTMIPEIHGATTVMVMGPDSDTPVPSTTHKQSGKLRIVATILGGAAVIGALAWYTFH